MTREEFKEWRNRVGLTQAEVAKDLDVTEMTVYRWETGKTPILRTVELALKQIEAQQCNKVEESDKPVDAQSSSDDAA